MHPHRSLWMLALCATALSGQATPEAEAAAVRGRVFGVARNADRAPWREAEIRLVSQPYRGCREIDALEIRADEHGEFAAEILVGRVYSAWAYSPADDDRWRVSQVLDDVVAGLPVVLDENHTEPRVRLRFTGLDAWRDPGPVRLWCAGTKDMADAVPIGEVPAQGAITLPPTGTGERWTYLTAGNGLDLFRVSVPQGAQGEVEIEVPAPVDVPIEVREEDGTPVPEARLYVRSPSGFWLPGRTDANGRTSLTMPLAPDRTPEATDSLPVHAQAPGHFIGRLWPDAASGAGSWRIFVRPGEATEAQLLWTDGEPVASASVHISGVEQNVEPMGVRNGVPKGKPNGSFATDGYRVTDAAGKLSLACDPKYPIAIGLLLPDDRRAQMAKDLGAVPSQLALAWAGKAAPGQPIEARVDQLVPLRLRCLRPDRSPAQRARLRIAAGDNPGLGMEYVADQRGEVVVLVPAVDDIMVAVASEGCGDVFRIAARPREGAAKPHDVLLDLPPGVVIGGVVLDADGAPQVDSEVVLDHSLRGPRGAWSPVDGDGTTTSVVARGYYYPAMMRSLAYHQATRTDAEGRFEFRVPSLTFPMSLRIDDGFRLDVGTLDADSARALEYTVR